MKTPFFTLLFMALFSSIAFAAVNGEESSDRLVDEAAVDMQDDADADLALLVKRYAGTKREAEMLLRLAELRLEIADNLFRVAYAPGRTGLKKAYLSKLARGIEPLTLIIDQHPKAEAFARALFLRGKARKELGQSAPALADLEKFISRYSSREEAGVAAMGIADLSLQKQNFGRAISVLAPLAKTPSHPLYLNALAKRAWALQADGKPQSAVTELARLASAFKSRVDSKTLSAGDQSLRESVQGDVPAIAYLAFQSNPKSFSLRSVNDLFRQFDQSEGYQRMAVRFADHLRTADLNADLRTWKGLVLKSDPSQQSLEMVIGILEYDLERDSYEEVVRDVADVATIVAGNPEHTDAERARKLVVRAANKLTKRMTDYRKTERATEAESSLREILTSFDRMTSPSDSRRIALRWNLAETHFALEDYTRAAAAYRWMATNWNSEVKPTEVLSPARARLQAIESRYQSLREARAIPESLEVKTSALPKNDARVASLREFLAWIEESQKLDGQALESYAFDAMRGLYAAGYIDEALERAKTMALSNPSAKHSLGAASLVVDTAIARKRWDTVEGEARRFAAASGWTSKTFAREMLTQAAAAKFKRAEIAFAAKDYVTAGIQAREFRAAYPKSNLSLDAMGIACNSDLSRSALDSAVECFTNLATEFPKSKAARQALLTAARIEDDRFRFMSAAELYGRALRFPLSASESLTLRKRVLLLVRAEGDASKMESVSSGRRFCSPKLERECELNRALAALIRNENSTRSISKAFSQMGRGAPEHRSIWATLALEHAAHADPRAVNRALQTLAQTWERTDPSIQYFLISRLTKSVPALLERGREAVKSIAVVANEASISRRMRALQGFENRTGLVLSIPVNAIRMASQAALFLSYNDFIADLRAIPAPTAAMAAEQNRLLASFVQPFVLKARKIRDVAMGFELREKRGLNLDRVDSIWDRSGAIGSEWSKAIQSGEWTRVAFFSNEAAEMKGVSAGWAKAARAFSLGTAGAAAEAKTVFSDACRESGRAPALREACKGRG